MRALLLGLGLLVAPASLAAAPAHAAELVMFDTDGCYHCLEWKRQVGRYYHKTIEGSAAPLTVLDIRGPRPAHLHNLRTPVAAPTFVLVENGRELGRIVGYDGEQRFWQMVEALFQGL